MYAYSQMKSMYFLHINYTQHDWMFHIFFTRFKLCHPQPSGPAWEGCRSSIYMTTQLDALKIYTVCLHVRIYWHSLCMTHLSAWREITGIMWWIVSGASRPLTALSYLTRRLLKMQNLGHTLLPCTPTSKSTFAHHCLRFVSYGLN